MSTGEPIVIGNVSQKNEAVQMLGTELAGLTFDFRENVYAVRVNNGNPWVELISETPIWTLVEA